VAFHSLYALGITGGSHRLWAHKSYTASPPLKVLLMLLNAGANQGSIFHWARDHRLHHKFSDTEYDPHTMARGFFFAHVGWLLEKKSDKMIE
jgi:stearoyl-CoA desaturase (delta-9 desaturase)